MTQKTPNNFPKLHNAMWPGLVGKGGPGAEPCLDLDTMLDLTSRAEVNGVKFDGVDLFLFDPHVSIDSGLDDLKKVAEKIRWKATTCGSKRPRETAPATMHSTWPSRAGMRRLKDS